MKKLLLVALAAVGMAACVQNEELGSVSNGNAIVFDNAFINNATKAAIDGSYAQDKGNFDHFNVWATITNESGTANIFENEAVTKSGNAWYYDAANTQYWIPGNRYNFVGIVDAADVTVNDVQMPVAIKTSLANQKDVLYATHNRSYDGGVVTPVHLQFNHLLAKAKFTVKNEIPAEYSGFTYTVESIIITNADNEAEYSIADEAWAATSTYEAAFGAVTTANEAGAEATHLGYQGKAESNWERLILPAAGKALTIKVNYTLRKDAWSQSYEKELVANLDIEKGRAYNFVLELGAPGEAITFDAEVKDWVPEGDKVSSLVTTADQLVSALADSTIDVIYLGEDVNLNSLVSRAADPSLAVAAGRTVVLDLNGKTLSATSTQTGKNYDMFDVRGTLTVKNGTVDYVHEGTNMGWSASTNLFNVTAGGVLNLEGVTAKNNGGSDMGFVAHLNNWGEVTLNAENCVLESNYVAVRVFNSGYDMNNVTIKNSTLKGSSAAFWVHNYTTEDFGTAAKAEAQKALLNLNIYNQGNTFSPDVNGVRYGFTNSVRSDAYGITKSVSEDGTEVTLGSVVEDGLVRRGVAGDEENTTIKKVVVGEGITTLYDRTFRRFYALEEVILPSTLTTIGAAGSGVFQSCTNLKNVVIPETVTVLGKGSFYGCSALESINIPAGVTRIEENCLRETGIKKIEFHEGVTYFGAQAFRDCKQLKEVVINAPQFTIEANCFGSMAAPYPAFTIYVANAEMKAYLESTLAYANQFTVVAPEVIDNTAALQTALAEGKNVNLANDLTITPTEMSTAPYGNKMALSHNGGVFNGNDNHISVTAGGDNYVVMTNGGTIKNLNIDRGFRGIVVMYPNQDLYVDNVKIGVDNEVCYTINTAEGDGTHSLYISNSELNGWCSIGSTVKDVTFTNCKFGQGTYYTDVYGRLVKPYVNAVFDGCDFCSKCYIDLSAFVGTKVVVKNCTVNGVKLTAENWASIIAPESTCGEGQISVELKNGTYLTAENVADYFVIE